MCQHIQIFLPNRPGEFYKVAKLFGDNNINIIGYHLASQGDVCVLQLMCVPHDKAFCVAREQYRTYCSQRKVIVVRIANSPGQLFKILEVLSEKSFNIANSYQIGGKLNNALVIIELLKEDDFHICKNLLKNEGIDVLETVEDEV